jgi:hypothetical protein
LFCHPELATDLSNLGSLTEVDRRLSEHGDDLLVRIPFPANLLFLSSRKIKSHRLERYEGAGRVCVTDFWFLSAWSSTMIPSGTTDESPGLCAGVISILQNLDAVDKNVDYAGGVLVGFLVGRVILNLRWIENHDIGEIVFLEASPSVQLQVFSRQRSELANRFFQRNQFFFPYEFPQQPGETAVGTGVHAGS